MNIKSPVDATVGQHRNGILSVPIKLLDACRSIEPPSLPFHLLQQLNPAFKLVLQHAMTQHQPWSLELIIVRIRRAFPTMKTILRERSVDVA